MYEIKMYVCVYKMRKKRFNKIKKKKEEKFLLKKI